MNNSSKDIKDNNSNYINSITQSPKDVKAKINNKNFNKLEDKAYDYNKFVISNKYQLIKLLGSGSFGEVHLAIDLQIKKALCLKFELNYNNKIQQLNTEYNVLKLLNCKGIKGFPKVLSYERENKNYSFMTMELLGPSLADLFAYNHNKFSIITVALIGIQILDRLESLHEINFIHRDLKPENFLMGLNELSNIVYMIDLGLSKSYKNTNSTTHHIPYKENNSLVGTIRYASINNHLGIESSRRDDLESLLYMLIYFAQGKLPWQKLDLLEEDDKELKRIADKKLKTPIEVLCNSLPQQFVMMLQYCKNLKFEDRPDYIMLKNLLNEVLISSINFDNIEVFIPIINEDSINIFGINSSNSKKETSNCNNKEYLSFLNNVNINKKKGNNIVSIGVKNYYKFLYSEFIRSIDNNNCNYSNSKNIFSSIDYNPNELYLTSESNLVFVNKELNFIFDWQIDPKLIESKHSLFGNKNLVINNRIQEEKSESSESNCSNNSNNNILNNNNYKVLTKEKLNKKNYSIIENNSLKNKQMLSINKSYKTINSYKYDEISCNLTSDKEISKNSSID